MSQQLEIIKEADVTMLRSAKPPEEEFKEMTTLAEKLAAEVGGITVTSSDQKDAIKLAKDSRIALKNLRCQIERKHKELKAFYLEGGRRIDLIKTKLVRLIEPHESRLLECEQFAEREAERLRRELQMTRAAELAKYEMPGITAMNLAGLMDDEYAQLLADAQQMQGNRRIAAEKAAADLAAAQEAAKKAQAEAAAKAEADKAEAARLASEERKRHEAERSALEADNRRIAQERQKAQAEADEANRKLRAAEAARQQELAAERRRQEAEKEAQRERDRLAAEAAERAKTAPDAVRMKTLLAPAEALRDQAASLEMASAKGREMLIEVRACITNLNAAIAAKVGELEPFAY